MFNINQFREYIIKPVLSDLTIYSDQLIELLIFTCAAESNGGDFLHQVNGSALGIYQMEPTTYNDIWQNFIRFKSSIKLQLLHKFNAPVMPDESRLIYDLRFATAMTVIHYERVTSDYSSLTTPLLLWDFYKKHYNTYLGKAQFTHSMDAYTHFKHNY